MMDLNNFTMDLRGVTGHVWKMKMTAGELTIDGVDYEDVENDPTYDMVRALALAVSERGEPL